MYSPKMMLRTNVYAFNGDYYGAIDSKPHHAPNDIIYALKKHNTSNNEIMFKGMTTLLDGIEFYVLDSEAQRKDVIDAISKLGITEIRGETLDKRFIVRSDYETITDYFKKKWMEMANEED